MTIPILPKRITHQASPDGRGLDAAVAVSINTGKPGRLELDRINDVITAATCTWNLPERVKRISLPLYRYLENDLEHMQFLLAETGETGIVGLAALEAIEATEGPDECPALLLHGLYVYPWYHRRGVGTRLIESAEATAQAYGVSGLLVRAQIDAQLFFEKRGFEKLPIECDSRGYAYCYWKSI